MQALTFLYQYNFKLCVLLRGLAAGLCAALRIIES